MRGFRIIGVTAALALLPTQVYGVEEAPKSQRFSLTCLLKPDKGSVKLSDQTLVISFDRPTSSKIDVTTLDVIDNNSFFRGKPIVEFNLHLPEGLIGIFAKTPDKEYVSLVGNYKKETGVFSSSLFFVSPTVSREQIESSTRNGGCSIAPQENLPGILLELEKRDRNPA